MAALKLERPSLVDAVTLYVAASPRMLLHLFQTGNLDLRRDDTTGVLTILGKDVRKALLKVDTRLETGATIPMNLSSAESCSVRLKPFARVEMTL